jgi:hypothetical protein
MGFVIYTPPANEQELFEKLIRKQINGQIGFGYGFAGMPYQRGAGLGSVFASLFRAITPMAKSAAKALGKKALNAGLEVAADTLAGQNFKESLKTHAKALGQDVVHNVQTTLKRRMEGNGLGRRPKRAKTVFDL